MALARQAVHDHHRTDKQDEDHSRDDETDQLLHSGWTPIVKIPVIGLCAELWSAQKASQNVALEASIESNERVLHEAIECRPFSTMAQRDHILLLLDEVGFFGIRQRLIVPEPGTDTFVVSV